MDRKNTIEISTVWLTTGIAAILNFLPQINDVLTTIILLGTVIYTWRKVLKTKHETKCKNYEPEKIPIRNSGLTGPYADDANRVRHKKP